MANKFLNGIEVSSSAVVDGGSLSTGSTILDIQGSQGQLFSVTNSLVGDLFSVSDISGVPILNVNSSGLVTVDGSLSLGDSDKIQFGASQDLKIYHDGSNSYISEIGTGDLIISADNDLTFKDGSGNIMANMNASNSVELMFGNSKKFETTSAGVAVTGAIDSGAITSTGVITATGGNSTQWNLATPDQDLSGKLDKSSGTLSDLNGTYNTGIYRTASATTSNNVFNNGTIATFREAGGFQVGMTDSSSGYLKWRSYNAYNGSGAWNEISGNNTGDQDLSSYITTSTADGKYLLNTTDTLTGTLTATNALSVTSVDSGNPQSAVNESRLSGYGLMMNRGTSYITNAHASGQILFGIGGAHNNNTEFTLSGNGGVFAGSVTASNLSGTNTGDQDLSGYLLNTTDSLNGNLDINSQAATNSTTRAEMIANSVLKIKPHSTNSGNLSFAQVDGGNSIGLSFTNGAGTSNWDISLNPFGGNVAVGIASASEKLSVGGNVLATGTVLGSNLSGTNTGDQTLTGLDYAATSHSHNDLYYTETESDAKYLLNTSDTLTGTLIVDGGTGVVSSGVFHVRQKGDTVADGIAITSSNGASHRIWKDGSGNLNLTNSGGAGVAIDLSGNVSATNLSGTNTGDQTLPTDFVSASNGGTFSGNIDASNLSGTNTGDNSANTNNSLFIDRGALDLTSATGGNNGLPFDNAHTETKISENGMRTLTYTGASAFMYTFANGGSASVVQYGAHYNGNDFYMRTRTDSSAWNDWRKLYHDNNIPTWNQNTTGNAATVTTNANLTGHITSVGNAAVLGSFTTAQLNAAISDGSINIDQTLPTDFVSAASGGTFGGAVTVTGELEATSLDINGAADFTGKVDFQGDAAIEGGSGYGVFKGYTSNDNHFISVRGIVANTSTLSITGGHQTTFVEQADQADEGWYFKSNSTGTYREIARIDGLGQMYLGGNQVFHVGHKPTYSEIAGTVPTWNQNTTGNASTASSATIASKVTINSGFSGTYPMLVEVESSGIIYNNTNVTYNGTSNTLTSPNFSGNLTGNVTGNVTGSAGSVAWGNITSRPYILNSIVTSATTTTTVANVIHATYTAAFFDFVIKNGTNVRAGIVYACHDGTNVEYAETSTVDLGDTSDVTLSVDISGTNMRLRATTTSSTWTIKSLIRAI